MPDTPPFGISLDVTIHPGLQNPSLAATFEEDLNDPSNAWLILNAAICSPLWRILRLEARPGHERTKGSVKASVGGGRSQVQTILRWFRIANTDLSASISLQLSPWGG